MALVCAATCVSAQSSVTLAWDPSLGASGYNVHFGTVSQNHPAIVPAGSATSATITNLTPGITYYFVVAAYGWSGVEGPFSEELSYTVPVSYQAPPAIVLTPTSVAAYVAPANIVVMAYVTPNGHTINSVQFYNGATSLGQNVGPGPSYGLFWGNIAAGTYSLTARVVYDGDSTVDSSLFSFDVGPAGSVVLNMAVNGSKHVVLTGVGQANHTFDVQASTDLTTWTTIGDGTNSGSGSFQWTDPGLATNQVQTYRLVIH